MPQLLRMGPTLHVEDADWLAFDLDHALARYRVPELMRLIYECLCRAMTELGTFPAAAFARGWDSTIPAKGVLVDFHTGDTLKLAESGEVAFAFHGTTELSVAEVARKYGTAPWPGFEILRRQGRHHSFFVLLTYFDIPAALAFQQAVDWADASADADTAAAAEAATLQAAVAAGQPYDNIPVPPRYAGVASALMDAFNWIFDNVAAWDSGRGGFFAAVRADPLRYVWPRPHLAARLRSCRAEHGKRVLLVTNSHIRFGALVLEASLGPQWRECFDLVVFNGSKPAFFTKHALPFLGVDFDAGTEGAPLVALGLPQGRLLAAPPLASQGNAQAVQALADALLHAERRQRHVASHARRGRSGDRPVGKAEEHPAAPHACHAGDVCSGEHGPSVVLHFEALSGTVARVEVQGHGSGVGEHPTAADAVLRTEPPVLQGGTTAAETSLPPQARSLTDDFPGPSPTNLAPGAFRSEGDAPPLAATAGAGASLGHHAAPSSSAAPATSTSMGRQHAKILYFGDHLHGDVVASSTALIQTGLHVTIGSSALSTAAAGGEVAIAAAHTGWPAIAVVEELEWCEPGSAAMAAIGAAGGGLVALPATPPANPDRTPASDAAAASYSVNFERGAAADVSGSAWGSFFVACRAGCAAQQLAHTPHGAVCAAEEARGAATAKCGPCCGQRSYFCSLVQQHAVLAVSDVEAALDALLLPQKESL